MKILFNKKKIEVDVENVGAIGRIFGLMFKSRNTENLLFEFKRNINLALHSWFVFFNFYVIWLDKNNRVLEFRKIRPFTTTIWCSSSFRKIIEIPANNKNKRLISFIDGKN